MYGKSYLIDIKMMLGEIWLMFNYFAPLKGDKFASVLQLCALDTGRNWGVDRCLRLLFGCDLSSKL